MATKKNKIQLYYNEVGRLIKKYRQEKKLTLEQLGFEVGLNKSDIFNIEKGKNITILTLLKIALVLEKDIIVFFDFKNPVKKEDLDSLIKSK
jgi:transcriptional regulator with XRE-family HTH domain